MKITVDTNVLVRAAVGDDPRQAQAAAVALKNASLLAVPAVVLCEFVWVLKRVYGFDNAAIVSAIRSLLAAPNVKCNPAAVEAGLRMLEKGGDFADGVAAYEGAWLGGDTFVSFDKQAIKLLKAQGATTTDLNM